MLSSRSMYAISAVIIYCLVCNVFVQYGYAQLFTRTTYQFENKNFNVLQDRREWNVRLLVPGQEALRPSHVAVFDQDEIYIHPQPMSVVERTLVRIGEYLRIVSVTIPENEKRICQLSNYNQYTLRLVRHDKDRHEVNVSSNNSSNISLNTENKMVLQSELHFLSMECDKCIYEEECGKLYFDNYESDCTGKHSDSECEYAGNNSKEENVDDTTTTTATTTTKYTYYTTSLLPLRVLDSSYDNNNNINNNSCIQLPFDLIKVVIHVLSNTHAVLTIYLLPHTKNANKVHNLHSHRSQATHVNLLESFEETCEILLEAWREENVTDEITSDKTRYITVILLLIVIAVRFGPRYVLRRRGQIDSESFRGHRVNKIVEERRRKLMQMQEQLISKMKAADNITERQ